MSCWRVLELSEEPNDVQVPQLLVKPDFGSNSYTVHLTDLSNIWIEELDLAGIVGRASDEQSPIEVSKQDTTQLAILLDNVKKTLACSDDTTCRVTCHDGDGVTLHTTVSLPKPLDSLTWKFVLEKRTSITLKNELILPLLVSSHIQHERISHLISIITGKDKAITRLVDQYESSNLDLAAAFPSVGGFKSGKRMIKREQAAKHVPALQPFHEEAWREETGQLEDSDVSTLGLFQEALAQSTPKVPIQLKSEDLENAWWSAVPDHLTRPKATVKNKAKKSPIAKPKEATVESSEDETEDEFETHENFKKRNLPSKPAKARVSTPPLTSSEQVGSEEESTEDDDDLDALPKSQSRSRSRTHRTFISRAKSSTPETPSPPKVTNLPATKVIGRGFRIGGKARQAENNLTSPGENPVTAPDVALPSSPVDPEATSTPKKARRPFKIGGRGKAAPSDEQLRRDIDEMDHTKPVKSPTADTPSSPPPSRVVKEETPVEELPEETPEHKAERKRLELKRKNEEAARKQAQQKKKKRF
ncbi:XRCC4-like factor-domain-containing protein [Pyrenochaeta sp. MPI-SDFR-AT-0127]|nr:XRCC4-like factor-domain-containing protein [Pyrenochaeta sp. MPI-SDFR-AT-0127]